MMELHPIIMRDGLHETARWCPEPPFVESDEADHVSFRRHRLPVAGRWHPLLWQVPTGPWMQETITNEILKFFLCHRGTNPRFHGKDLALSRHQRKASATAVARKGRRR
jgi:hypothetical protein